MWPFNKKHKKPKEQIIPKLNGLHNTDKTISVIYAEKNHKLQQMYNLRREARMK